MLRQQQALQVVLQLLLLLLQPWQLCHLHQVCHHLPSIPPLKQR
jgi:hypothetical protein